MKNEIIENSNEAQLNIIKNEEELCPYCSMSIPLNLFKDHTFCHILEQEEKSNNNKINNNINNQNTNKCEIIKKEDKNDENISDKIFGFFENVKNKAKEIFTKEDEEKKEENDKKPKSNFLSLLGSIPGKISQKIDEIKQEFNDSEDSEEEIRTNSNNSTHIFILNSLFNRNRDNINNRNNRINSDYRNDNNIDDLLLRFEEEDDDLNKLKINPFKEEDAKEIMRYIPTSVIKEEKNKNDNNYKCLICLYEFKIGDKVCTLPCLHIFHTECLKDWIMRNTWCPICKMDFSLESLFKNNIVENA